MLEILLDIAELIVMIALGAGFILGGLVGLALLGGWLLDSIRRILNER